MICTINTDASFHPEHKVGAYAFWSVSNTFKITKAGYLRKLCKNPDDAEMKTIINALKVTLCSGGITKVIINTDSLNSIRVFENDTEGISKYNLYWAKKRRNLFNKIISDYNKKHQLFNGLQIEFRHVKAHSGKDDARSYVNEWCDKNAKYYLWRRIKELKLN